MTLLTGSPSAADACGLSRPCRGNRVSAFSPTARASAPKGPSYPSDRYRHTNPLRRESGLRLLTESLPEPPRWLLIRAWRRPAHFDGNEAIQSVHRQRPSEADLPTLHVRLLGFFTLTELEVSRRIVEAPLASISRVTRDRLLHAQGAYLRSLYQALVIQLGSAEAALAEFQRLLACMG